MVVPNPDASLFRNALQYADKELSDSEVVLILSFLNAEDAYVSTTTEVMRSIIDADTVFELAEQYVRRKWEQQREILAAQGAHKYSLVQYLPQSRQLRKHTQGIIKKQKGVH